jgi:hypothetical protein
LKDSGNVHFTVREVSKSAVAFDVAIDSNLCVFEQYAILKREGSSIFEVESLSNMTATIHG